MESLDTLMCSVCERTLEEFLSDAYRLGWEQGYEHGIKAGRRLVRGKSEFPSTGPGKSRGDPEALCHKLLQSTGLYALVRSVYGCTLDELLTKNYGAAYQRGYERGIKAGKRLAKGKSEFPSFGPGTLKSRGAPGALHHKLLRQQFIDYVESRIRESGISPAAAVSSYCDLMSRAWKGLDGAPELRQEQLLRLYKRATKPRLALDDQTSDLPST
jgi:hypothetical protein